MRFVLVRHGEPAWVEDGINRDDPRLTPTGRRQAYITGATLADQHFDHIWVSPKLRARQTSEPFLDLTRRTSEIKPFLEEIQTPDWEGTHHDALEVFAAHRRRDPTAQWSGLEGGEAVSDFHDRVTSGLDDALAELGVVRSDHDLPTWDIAQAEPSDERPADEISVLVFAHAGTNSMVLSHLLGVAPVPWEWERFVTFHASISVATSIQVGPNHAFSLLTLSDLGHLPVDLRTR